MTEPVRNRIALPTALAAAALLLLVALRALAADTPPSPNSAADSDPLASANGAISPQNQADALHHVIAANRAVYCRVHYTQSADRPGAPLPSPCELLRRAAESIQSQGAEFSYALRSLHPLDPRNEPQTELEREGLAFVARHPAQPYYGRETLGGRRYVTAVYADLPATAGCIACHDRRSTKTASRHRIGEHLGGIVVRVPLEF